MVIQRRVPNGTVNFTRNWSDYENGFGDLEGEFWYGLRNFHHLTTRDEMELRIDMVREDDGTEFSWTYQTFRVAGADDNYRLTIGEGEGTCHDAMAYNSSALMIVTMITGVVVIVQSYVKEDGGTMLVTVLISMVHTQYPQTQLYINRVLSFNYGKVLMCSIPLVL